MGYKQLTEEERYQIYGLLTAGKTKSEIAMAIGVHKSTITREIQRNSGQKGYRPKQAHKNTSDRRSQAYKHIKMIPPIIEFIEQKIRLEWSPDQISGRLLLEYGTTISHERIYQHIQQDKLNGGTLYTHLRQGHKKRKRRCGKDRRGVIKNRTSIENRPIEVDEKNRIGDLERDLVIGKNHQGAVLTIVDRGTQMLFACKVNNKSSDCVGAATIELLEPWVDCLKTLTNDNGKEFADHEHVSQNLELPIYFCHPYSSYERGLNENTNGLLRQYFPKKTNFHHISNKEIAQAVDKLNNRPRKTLNYATPVEVFCAMYEKDVELQL